jgi:hypothetical protein
MYKERIEIRRGIYYTKSWRRGDAPCCPEKEHALAVSDCKAKRSSVEGKNVMLASFHIPLPPCRLPATNKRKKDSHSSSPKRNQKRTSGALWYRSDVRSNHVNARHSVPNFDQICVEPNCIRAYSTIQGGHLRNWHWPHEQHTNPLM